MSEKGPDHDALPEGAVAIIGMAARLPGAPDVETFWDNLLAGRESITTFTDEELRASGVDPALVRSPGYVKARGIIEGADEFDASFFRFTPRDAELLDPQHRIFLECAWHALEDGGYPPEKTDARVAVFGGVGTNWHLSQVADLPQVKKHASAASVVTGNDKDYVTTRISYKLGLTGPSVNVQCACSTSLVGTLLGMSSLRSYQCDLALAGGATIEIPERKGYIYQEGGMESPDGHCRPFDAKARGTVFSRGCAVVLLKRLEDAVRDRDHIYAVLLDGAINNDGSLKAGFTAPSVSGQEEAGIEALERSGVSAADLSFVEAHGTATSLGDPIEVTSLSRVFARYTDRKQFCALGSVKGNIGHTDVAAGATGVIKTALALRERRLPASVNFEEPNPEIDFPESPFFVNTELLELENGTGPVRGLVNAFGVGGTNASAVLQEPPRVEWPGSARERNVVLLSARSRAALEATAERLRRHLEARPELHLDDVAYTTQVGRADFAHRRYLVASGREEMMEKLTDAAGASHAVVTPQDDGRPLVFGFPGQGNQFLGMGRDLYDAEPVFREAVDRCCEILEPILGLDLRDVIFAGSDAAEDARRRLDETDVTQPALFVISWAMARLWRSRGLDPDVLVGHSVGEYVAAALANVFSLEDALRAVAHRGRLIQALPRGSMLAVLLPEEQVEAELGSELSVAAVNGPQLTVVSGPTPAIEELRERLEARRIFAKSLDTSHAFHSAMMDPALDDFDRIMSDVELQPPRTPIVSTVTGRWLTDQEAVDPSYWVQHMRRPVRFGPAVETIFSEERGHILLECGPGRSLASAAKRLLGPDAPHDVVSSMGAGTDEGASDLDETLKAVGALWSMGRPVSWDALYGTRKPGRVPLPGYPFERQSFALDLPKHRNGRPGHHDEIDDRKKPDVGDWFYLSTWRRKPVPELLEASGDGAEPPAGADSWLVFEDGHGIAEAVLELLRASGKDVSLVVRGDEFARAGDTFTVRPGSAKDHDRVIAALVDEDRGPGRILHLWNVDLSLGTGDLEELEEREDLAFYSPLFLEQACQKHSLAEGLRILVGASGAVDVAGEGIRDPGGALAIGPSRTLRKETPKARARFVDTDIPETPAVRARLARHLVSEVAHDRDEDLVAYRRGYRWVEGHEQVRLAPSEDFPGSLSADGVYLITGGLGGLGLFVAGRMAREAPCTLALLSRSGLPERDDWDDWLQSHAHGDPTSARIRGIREVEEAGATVTVVQADCGDLEAMEDAVARLAEEAGPVRGVIHAAGMAGGGIISLKTEEMAAEVLRPKVRGTLVLDRLFAGRELDFFVLFSSITSLLGEAGRVDYCSANCFMDALAQKHAAEGTREVVSINWPSWAAFGMAARWEETRTRRVRDLARKRRDEPGTFLRLVDRDGDEEIYDVLLDPDSDWVITDHLVFDIPTLIGAGFFQFLVEFAGLKRPAARPVVERALFLSPAMFQPDEARRVRLFVGEAGDGYRFSFRSQRLTPDGKKGRWHEHFRGRLALEEGGSEKTVDLERIRDRMEGEVDEPSFRSPVEEGVIPYLRLSRRWDTLEAFKLGDDEWLAKLRLPEEFRDDLDEWSVHPSMLDVSMAAATWRVVGAPFLPAGFDRVAFSGSLPEKLWSHIHLREFPGDTVSFDVTLLDDGGRELVRIDGYTLRKVSEDTLEQEAPSAAGTGAADSEDDEESTDIQPDEGWDAFCRIMATSELPQMLVSTRDLQGFIDEENETAEAAGKPKDEDEGEAASYARPALSTPYEAPANAIEEAVAEVWSGVLGIGEIGVNDDFAELGGNSLLAVQTVANTADVFDVDLSVDAFLKKPTVRGVAETVVELLVSMADEDTLEELMATLDE